MLLEAEASKADVQTLYLSLTAQLADLYDWGNICECNAGCDVPTAPMWEISAKNMIPSIKACKMPKGVRGNPPADIEAIKLCVLRLCQMIS